jgi:hypothetical protein
MTIAYVTATLDVFVAARVTAFQLALALVEHRPRTGPPYRPSRSSWS